MKSYTDLEQSKKLAEILPIESADQIWARIAIVGANLNVPEEQQYRHNGDMSFQYYSGIGIPAWSLAALIDLMPNVNGHYPELCRGKQTGQYYMWIEDTFDTQTFDNPIDAAFEMICWLKENNKI